MRKKEEKIKDLRRKEGEIQEKIKVLRWEDARRYEKGRIEENRKS